MERWGNKNKLYETEILHMPISADEEKKVKYTELKYSRCQYAETKKANENIQNWNTAEVNMGRRGKESKIYRTEILQMWISRGKASKVNYTELKWWWYQREQTKQTK